MSSREKILNEISKNKPALTPMPASFSVERNEVNLVEKFMDVLTSIGGKVKTVDDWQEVVSFFEAKLSTGAEVVNGIQNLPNYNVQAYSGKEATQLQHVKTFFLRGGIAVAENGATWVSESKMVNRMLPFICEELVMVINEGDIVANMHEAYSKITVTDEGYGVFIAGPSKTADIEQSLVIGAHGPLSLHVFILKN